MRSAIPFLVAFIFLLTSCISQVIPTLPDATSTTRNAVDIPLTPPLPPVPISPAAGDLAEAANRFGFDLMQEMAGIRHSPSETETIPSSAQSVSPLATPEPSPAPDTNLLFSPLSLSLVLGMTYNGADGETAAEMAQVLHIEEMEAGLVNQATKELQDNLRAAQGVELSIGNSLWLRQDWTLDSEYVEQNRTAYDATLEVLDFDSPEAVTRINQWAEEATQGKIDTVLDRIEDEVLFLLNAVYFKGNWLDAFNPARTQPFPFHRADGTTKEIPMMQQSGTFPFLAGDGFQAVALPYQGERVRMLVFLPDADRDLNSFLGQLTLENWQVWTAEFQEQEIFVGLPSFKVKFTRELNDDLESLGMATAFDDRANLLRMLPTEIRDGIRLYLSFVKHDAIVEVNEEGTIAAAVSTVGASPSSGPPSFIVDRPFFFAIWDSHTGAILFLGAVVDPEPLE